MSPSLLPIRFTGVATATSLAESCGATSGFAESVTDGDLLVAGESILRGEVGVWGGRD